jgi:hypothetical protein
MILEDENTVTDPFTDWIYYSRSGGAYNSEDNKTRPNSGISHYTVEQLRDWSKREWGFICVAREPITPNELALIEYWRRE